MRWHIVWIIVLSIALAACGGTADTTNDTTTDNGDTETTQATATPSSRVAQLPEGNVADGEEVFQQSIGGLASCSSCHMVNEDGIGPMLAGYAERAGERVEGQDAREYTYNSIINPSDYVVEGYRNGVMPAAYGSVLSDQQLADLIAYYLSFDGETG